MKGKKVGHAKHHVHHEHKAGSEAHVAHVHLKKGGKVEKHKVEGKKAKARLDKFARGGKACFSKGGQVVEGNKHVIAEAHKGDAPGVDATTAKGGKRPGIGESTDKEDD